MGFQADCRAAAVTTLGAHAAAASISLNVYPGRPRSVKPPHAFVDVVRENIEYIGHTMKRTVQVDVVLLHGLFDSGEAAAGRDAFVDGYIDYVRNNQFSAAGANTTFAVVSTEDDPVYVTDWIAPTERSAVTYFATRITLEGFAGD